MRVQIGFELDQMHSQLEFEQTSSLLGRVRKALRASCAVRRCRWPITVLVQPNEVRYLADLPSGDQPLLRIAHEHAHAHAYGYHMLQREQGHSRGGRGGVAWVPQPASNRAHTTPKRQRSSESRTGLCSRQHKWAAWSERKQQWSARSYSEVRLHSPLQLVPGTLIQARTMDGGFQRLDALPLTVQGLVERLGQGQQLHSASCTYTYTGTHAHVHTHTQKQRRWR
jgi:hypothetical protein